MLVTITQGDTRQIFRARLTWPDGTAVDLSGATVYFVLQSFGAISTYVRTAVQAGGNAVEYQPIEEDVSLPGKYWQRWKVVFTGGSVQNFPNDTFNVVEILRKLS